MILDETQAGSDLYLNAYQSYKQITGGGAIINKFLRVFNFVQYIADNKKNPSTTAALFDQDTLPIIEYIAETYESLSSEGGASANERALAQLQVTATAIVQPDGRINKDMSDVGKTALEALKKLLAGSQADPGDGAKAKALLIQINNEANFVLSALKDDTTLATALEARDLGDTSDASTAAVWAWETTGDATSAASTAGAGRTTVRQPSQTGNAV